MFAKVHRLNNNLRIANFSPNVFFNEYVYNTDFTNKRLFQNLKILKLLK